MVTARVISKLLVIVALFLMAGCAAPEVKRRFYWPPLPDEPKIEFIGAYRSKLDMPRTKFERVMDDVAGVPEATMLKRPLGIVSDGGDKVYVSDFTLSSVLVFDFINRTSDHIGSGKGDETIYLDQPAGLALDRGNNLYVCESTAKRISVFSPGEKLLRTMDISKHAKQPVGLAIDHERNRLLVGDVRAQVVLVFDLNGELKLTIGKEGGGDADGAFLFPAMMAVMRNGNIVVADSMNARVQMFDPDGKFIRKFGSRGDGPSDFQIIKGIAVDSENHIYITDAKSHNVKIYSETGDYLLSIGGAYSAERQMAPGGFLIPQGIFIDQNDRIYVADQMNGRFQIYQYMNERYLKEHPVERTNTLPPPAK